MIEAVDFRSFQHPIGLDMTSRVLYTATLRHSRIFRGTAYGTDLHKLPNRLGVRVGALLLWKAPPRPQHDHLGSVCAGFPEDRPARHALHNANLRERMDNRRESPRTAGDIHAEHGRSEVSMVRARRTRDPR